MTEKTLTKDDDLVVYRECHADKEAKKHFTLLIAKPKKVAQNKYKCVYSLVGEKFNLTFPVYGQDALTALLFTLEEVYATAITNNLNLNAYGIDEPEGDMKRFSENFINYMRHQPIILKD